MQSTDYIKEKALTMYGKKVTEVRNPLLRRLRFQLKADDQESQDQEKA